MREAEVQCESERVSESGECLICVRGVNFEKNPT